MSSTAPLTGLVEETQLLVVGAGPVGLFAGLCAARRGLSVVLVERNFRGCEHGHASILHPSSLRLLAEHGLSSQLQAAGSVVDRIDLWVEGRLVKGLDLAMPALTISQGAFEELLLKELRANAVEIKAPYVATAFEREPALVRTHIQRREPLGSPAHCDEWEGVEASSIDSAFVIGADGYNSGVREALGLDNLDVGATETFAMFEGSAASASSTLDLVFAAGLGSIAMPLPEQRARWGFQLVSALDTTPSLAQLRALAAGRMPWRRSPPERFDWSTVTHFERRLARSFGSGRVWLAGDAAHITSPFGGQSMNGGLTEVHDLVDRMADCLLKGKSLGTVEQLGAAREREWAKLLGYKVELQNPDHAPAWLREHARRIISALPASGLDLQRLMGDLAVTTH
jgi:2-polyprenyl-6-methoxyphenol hydroxylase-like FAD-dependent oxidoreductase